jgi:transcription elongation factor
MKESSSNKILSPLQNFADIGETKFFYGQQVKIKTGFLKGTKGYVKDVKKEMVQNSVGTYNFSIHVIKYLIIVSTKVRTAFGNQEVPQNELWIEEKDLKKTGGLLSFLT